MSPQRPMAYDRQTTAIALDGFHVIYQRWKMGKTIGVAVAKSCIILLSYFLCRAEVYQKFLIIVSGLFYRNVYFSVKSHFFIQLVEYHRCDDFSIPFLNFFMCFMGKISRNVLYKKVHLLTTRP